VYVETIEQPKQRMHTHSSDKPKKFKRTSAARKLKANVFLDRKGVLIVEFMQQGTTITSEMYCKTLKTA
jgi:predicted GIY-YIG superfamily endonuclease